MASNFLRSTLSQPRDRSQTSTTTPSDIPPIHYSPLLNPTELEEIARIHYFPMFILKPYFMTIQSSSQSSPLTPLQPFLKAYQSIQNSK